MQSPTTVTQKGQVTIPAQFRNYLDLKKGSKVVFTRHPHINDALIIKPVADFTSLRGSFKTAKKYDKKKARKTYLKEVLKGNI